MYHSYRRANYQAWTAFPMTRCDRATPNFYLIFCGDTQRATLVLYAEDKAEDRQRKREASGENSLPLSRSPVPTWHCR